MYKLSALESVGGSTTTVKRYNENIEWNKGENVPFEIRIPEDAKRSFIGKYSGLRWKIRAKFDIPWKYDVYTPEILVEIV
jgi:hypothetical protein